MIDRLYQAVAAALQKETVRSALEKQGLPIALKTNDPIKGWEAGLTWVFIQSFVLMIGGFVGPFIRKITPRAALLGTLAGVSVTFISMAPALQTFMTPVMLRSICRCQSSNLTSSIDEIS